MMRPTVVFVLALALIIPMPAVAKSDPIESVSRHYAASHPGLESYRVKLKTNKIDEMLARMTANMPKDVPRPDVPELMKFWNRQSGTVIRSTSTSAFPYMQQMIDRFSQRFAVDLGSLFLPVEEAAERKKLLQTAAVKTTEAEIAGQKTYHIEITFAEPTDISGAFYGTSLDLPQRGIKKLDLDIDPEKQILIHLDVNSEASQPLAVEIRHLDIANNILPSEVSITSPDGSVEEKFVTTFREIEGYHLPVKQERKIRRPGIQEELLVDFFDYELVIK